MRCQAKSLAMHHRDSLGLEQIAREILVALDPAALWGALANEAGAGRIDVERTLRPRAISGTDKSAAERTDTDFGGSFSG